MVLRFYKTPPQMDLFLSRMFTFYIYIAVIVHLSFGIWTYGNDIYFATYVSSIPFFQTINEFIRQQITSSVDPSSTFWFEIEKRIVKPHNLIMTLFLVLIILYYLFSTIIFKNYIFE